MSQTTLTTGVYDRSLAEHKLMGSRCPIDGRVYLPPREFCPVHFDDMEPVTLSGQGTLETFTIIYVAPSFMLAEGHDRKHPYCTGIVRLAEGPAISARILGVDVQHPDQIQLGIPVRAKYLERGEGDAHHTLLAFEPAR